jgi:hypothetical protein
MGRKVFTGARQSRCRTVHSPSTHAIPMNPRCSPYKLPLFPSGSSPSVTSGFGATRSDRTGATAIDQTSYMYLQSERNKTSPTHVSTKTPYYDEVFKSGTLSSKSILTTPQNLHRSTPPFPAPVPHHFHPPASHPQKLNGRPIRTPFIATSYPHSTPATHNVRHCNTEARGSGTLRVVVGRTARATTVTR